jgi:hypothetical protein
MRRFRQGVDTLWRLPATHLWELFVHKGCLNESRATPQAN